MTVWVLYVDYSETDRVLQAIYTTRAAAEGHGTILAPYHSTSIDEEAVLKKITIVSDSGKTYRAPAWMWATYKVVYETLAFHTKRLFSRRKRREDERYREHYYED